LAAKSSTDDVAAAVGAAHKEIVQPEAALVEDIAAADLLRNTSVGSVVVVDLARRTYCGAGRVQKEMRQRLENSTGECDRI
jgi:sulfate adenylyltransferase subunit 1 (EFTu-like GTPase family)